VLGFLGRLEPIKGLEVLLNAATRLGSQHVHVRIGGEGPPDYIANLRIQFPASHIAFLGRVTPREFFGTIDLLVVPSIVEDSLPRVVHEAFVHGVPVIGSAIGGIPEMISHGETGFLAPASDIGALENLLRQLLDNPPDWTAMQTRCLTASERYDLPRVLAGYRAAWHTARNSFAT
jgi:glycosyltransferase involved in cell wall biosynthesis